MKNELQVKIDQKAGKIDFNYEEMKAALEKTMSEYTDIVVTEDTRKIARSDLADLRKLKTALNDRRIEVKREYAKPYEKFKDKVDELIGLIDEPIELIDRQVKEFEEREREEKREKIKGIYEEEAGELNEYIPLEKIYNKRWENKSTTLKSIEEDIKEVARSVELAIETIKGMNSDSIAKALELYKEDLSLSSAIAYINNYEKQKQEIQAKEEAKRKAEEERKRQEEIEKAKEEERHKIAEIEKAKEEARQEALEEIKAQEEVIGDLPFLPDIEDSEAEEVFSQLPNIETPLTIDSQSIKNSATYVVFAEEKDLEKLETYMQYINLEYERMD